MADLRNRVAPASPKKDNNVGGERDRDLAGIIGKERAEKVSELFTALLPFLHALGQVLNQLWPHVYRAYEVALRVWAALQPYHPLDLGGVLFGLCLAFFGAHYVLVLAAVEAARLTGWDKIKQCVSVLYANWTVVHTQNLIDNAKDDDKNGVADVDELSRKELFTRKWKLLLRTLDPEQVTEALHGLVVVFFSIVATLRVQFAQTITLGAALSEAVYPPIEKYVLPIVAKGIHPEYRQWVPYVGKNLVRFACVSVAFTVQRVISGFYSAVRGGHLVAGGLLAYLVRYGHIAATHETDRGFTFLAIVGVTAVAGFYFQLAHFWGLPFPLNILLLPLRIAESVLLYFVANAQNAPVPT